MGVYIRLIVGLSINSLPVKTHKIIKFMQYETLKDRDGFGIVLLVDSQRLPS
jgi:hypothetical protein